VLGWSIGSSVYEWIDDKMRMEQFWRDASPIQTCNDGSEIRQTTDGRLVYRMEKGPPVTSYRLEADEYEDEVEVVAGYRNGKFVKGS
jgi:hypothetical protein